MELTLVGRLLAASILVGLVLYAVQFVAHGVVRRSATAMPGGRIVAILETTALPNAASLHVVRVAERYLLVGRSASQISMLCEIPSEDVASARAAPLGGVASAIGLGRLACWGSALRRLGRPNHPLP